MKTQTTNSNTLTHDNIRAKRLTGRHSKTIILVFCLACLCLCSAQLFAQNTVNGYILISGSNGSFELSGNNGFTVFGNFGGWPLSIQPGSPPTLSVGGSASQAGFGPGAAIIGANSYAVASISWDNPNNGPPTSQFNVTGGTIPVNAPGTYNTTFSMTGSLCGMYTGRTPLCDIALPNMSGSGMVTVDIGQYSNGSLYTQQATYNFCVPPPSDMVAWYSFDQNGSSQNDLSIYGNPNNVATGTFTNITGEVGPAVDFKGSGSATAPSGLQLEMGQGDFSIDAWVNIAKPVDYSGIVVLLDKRQSSPIQGYHLFLYNGQLGLQLADSSGYSNYVAATAVPADNQWHLVAVTVHRGKNGGVWYLDGNSLGTFDPSGHPGSLNSIGTSLEIGARSFGSGGFFKGGMDELEIFSRALTATEVQSLYQAGPAGTCK